MDAPAPSPPQADATADSLTCRDFSQASPHEAEEAVVAATSAVPMRKPDFHNLKMRSRQWMPGTSLGVRQQNGRTTDTDRPRVFDINRARGAAERRPSRNVWV